MALFAVSSRLGALARVIKVPPNITPKRSRAVNPSCARRLPPTPSANLSLPDPRPEALGPSDLAGLEHVADDRYHGP
jgi:hypothetical protein